MEILKNLDALFITNPTNIRYLTGFVGAAPEEREAFALLTQDQLFLFTNSLYLEAARKLSNPTNPTNKPITFVEISREEPFAKKLAETFQGNRLGFEENNLTVAEHEKLKKELQNITLVPTQGRIEELRMIKREDEIENIRVAAKLTDGCFDFIINKIKPTITEGEIAWEIESFIRSRGAELAFSPIVAFGANTSQPHYITQPQGRALSVDTSNIILLDFGAKVNGYCSDMTRMVFVGKPKKEWVKAYNAVLRAQTVSLEHLVASRPGLEATGSKADRVARTIIEKAGFPPYPHSLGHGVGLDIHEAPRLTIKKDEILKAGMVVTVEPAIYKEGNYGVRLEDLIVLKEEGVEILSQSPKTLIII